MTIDEVEHTLPNGFHDAALVGIEINFQTKSAAISLLLDVSALNSSLVDRVPATLVLNGLHTFRCEGEILSECLSGRALTISGFNPTNREFPGFDALAPELKAKFFGFYVADWNGFVCVAADEAVIVRNSPHGA